jgi:uncharacterized protein
MRLKANRHQHHGASCTNAPAARKTDAMRTSFKTDEINPTRRAVVCAMPAGMSSAAPARPPVASAALVQAARRRIGVTLIYDGSYRRIAYPGGDISAARGVCTDVVVRAYRSFGIHLQQLVHEGMTRAWSYCAKRWGLQQPDRNIDYRRVPITTQCEVRTDSLGKGQDLTPTR